MGRIDLPDPTPPQHLPFGLTHRELCVLLAAADGLTSKRTGEQLFIATSTVKNHRASVLRKMKARNLAHAVAKYMRWLRENDRLVRAAA